MIALLALAAATALPAPVPDRLFDCEVGQVTNLAATNPTELGLVGKHRLAVLQPAEAVELDTQPPRPMHAAWLVKVYDPDKVVAARVFDVVLDTWPSRLDFMALREDNTKVFVSFGQVDPNAGTATVSTGVILADGDSVDPARFMQGSCKVTSGNGLAAAFGRLSGGNP